MVDLTRLAASFFAAIQWLSRVPMLTSSAEEMPMKDSTSSREWALGGPWGQGQPGRGAESRRRDSAGNRGWARAGMLIAGISV